MHSTWAVAKSSLRKALVDKTAIINLSVLFLSYFAVRVGSFVTEAILARRLAPASYGVLNISFAVVSYLLLLPDAGLSVYGAREIAKNPERATYITKAIVLTRLVISLVVFVVYVVVLSFVNLDPKLSWVYVGSGTFLLAFAVNLEWLFQGLSQAAIVSVKRFLVQVASVAYAAVFIQSANDVVPASFLRTASELVGFCLLLAGAMSYTSRHPNSQKLNIRDCVPMLRASLPLGASAFLTSIYVGKLDSILLGAYFPPQVVGWYSAAYNIHTGMVGLVQIVVYVYFPLLARAALQGKESFERTRTAFLRTALVVALPTSVAGLLFAKPVIDLVFGNDFSSAVNALLILAVDPVIIGISATFAISLVAAGFNMDALVIYAGGLVTNVLCNAVLIPLISLHGAALATIASEFVVLLIGWRFYTWRKKTNRLV